MALTAIALSFLSDDDFEPAPRDVDSPERAMPVADHPFDADTAVTPIRDGVFSATVSDRWNRLLGGPLGGYRS